MTDDAQAPQGAEQGATTEQRGRWTTEADGVVPVGIAEVEDHTTPEQQRRNADAERMRRAAMRRIEAMNMAGDDEEDESND